MSMIEFKKVSIGYSGKIVCKDINFHVNKGDYLCIIGENGTGKSTLIKTLLGLNKPLSGKIIFNDNFNKNMIGYLPQQTDFQKDFPATVREIVMSGFINQMKLRPFFKRYEKEKATKIMQTLNIEDFAKRSYKELSGGQQQKVLLARALCATEELLVLDEPTNGLDARTIRSFYSQVGKLNKENGIAIIMISHNLDKVLSTATHILYLKDSGFFFGTKEEFLESDHGKSLSLEGGK